MRGRKKQDHKKRRLLGTALLVSVLAVLLSGDPPASALPEQTALPVEAKQEEPVRARVLEPARTTEAEEPPEETPEKPETMLVPEREPVEDAYFADTVFLGDSRTEGFHLYSGLKEGEYLYAVGATVDSVQTKATEETEDGTITLMDRLDQLEFSKVYIMLGVNELGWPKTEKFEERYGDIVDRIQETHPDARIALQSILPVSEKQEKKGSYVNNRRIGEYNEVVRRVAEEKNCVYLDVAEAGTGGDGCLMADLTSDGVHLNTKGCKLWLEYLEEHPI